MAKCEICQEREGKEHEVEEREITIVVCDECIEENQSAYDSDMRDQSIINSFGG